MPKASIIVPPCKAGVSLARKLVPIGSAESLSDVASNLEPLERKASEAVGEVLDR